MALSIEQIRAASRAFPTTPVEVPDLNGEVFVRPLTLDEVREIRNIQAAPKASPVDLTRKVVELATCNEDGTSLFVGEDVKLIGELPWGAIDAIADAAMRVSGMRPGAAAEEKKG